MKPCETFLWMMIGATGLGASPTRAADEPPGFETDCASIRIRTGSDELWDYTAKGMERAHAFSAPRVSLDGHDVTLALASARSLGPPAALANGAREYAFDGVVAGPEGLRLKLIFRAAADDPVVRFRYEVRSDRVHRLTKPEGVDRLRYLEVSLAGLPEAAELRLSEFNDELHSYMPVERPLGARLFADREEVNGPDPPRRRRDRTGPSGL